MTASAPEFQIAQAEIFKKSVSYLKHQRESGVTDPNVLGKTMINILELIPGFNIPKEARNKDFFDGKRLRLEKYRTTIIMQKEHGGEVEAYLDADVPGQTLIGIDRTSPDGAQLINLNWTIDDQTLTLKKFNFSHQTLFFETSKQSSVGLQFNRFGFAESSTESGPDKEIFLQFFNAKTPVNLVKIIDALTQRQNLQSKINPSDLIASAML